MEDDVLDEDVFDPETEAIDLDEIGAEDYGRHSVANAGSAPYVPPKPSVLFWRRPRFPLYVISLVAVLVIVGLVVWASLQPQPTVTVSPAPTATAPAVNAQPLAPEQGGDGPGNAFTDPGDGKPVVEVVGTDILPGLYTAPGGPKCQWSRDGTAWHLDTAGEAHGGISVAFRQGKAMSLGCGVWAWQHS